jgi:hypothetical protein
MSWFPSKKGSAGPWNGIVIHERGYPLIRAIFSTLGELFGFLWQNKLWWMAPIVVVLLLFSGLMFLAQSSALAPFVYTLF